MTETSGYNDPGSYDAAAFAAATDRMIKTGYQQGFLNGLAVSENTPAAMNVLVATGGCWIRGNWHLNDAVATLTIDAAHATLDRIDLIVARRTDTTSIELAVLKGTAASSPSAPTLTKTLVTHEIALAQVSIVHGTTAITSAMITDKRLSTDCGPVACEMGFVSIDPATGNLLTGGKQIVMATARITGLGDPTDDQDADTKAARNAAIAAQVPAGSYLGMTVKTSGSSFTTSANTTTLRLTLIGAGGGGGGVDGAADTYEAAGGGGAGACALKVIEVDPSTAYTYAIGALGAGGSAGNNNGTDGGDTTFAVGATTITAGGGKGGTGKANSSSGTAAPGAGGAGTNGDVNGPGAPGRFGVLNDNTVSVIAGAGADSQYGGGGIPPVVTANTATAGGDATGYGAGGAGAASKLSTSDAEGGDGSPGLIIIEEFA